jgi:hypothetical protein
MFGFGTCCLLRRRVFRFCSRRDQRSRDCNGFGALPDNLSTDCMRTDFGYLTRLSSRRRRVLRASGSDADGQLSDAHGEASASIDGDAIPCRHSRESGDQPGFPLSRE